jgi:hypothetical protein
VDVDWLLPAVWALGLELPQPASAMTRTNVNPVNVFNDRRISVSSTQR